MDKPLKILHLEDLQSDAELVDRELSKGHIHFTKVLVDTKKDYLNALRTFKPDVILSDHSLPSFNSMEALNILKEHKVAIPFILVTATMSEEFAAQMMQAGANDYVLKDRLQRLPGAIKSVVAKHTLEKERQQFLEKVIANEALMREAERIAHFGSWKYIVADKMISFSREMYVLLDYPDTNMNPTLKAFFSKIHPGDKRRLSKVINDIKRGTQQHFKNTFRLIDRHKKVKYVNSEIVVTRDSLHRIVEMTGFCQDVTELKTREIKLRTFSGKLRELTAHLQNVREDERAAIAREIHDALGQLLTALKIDIVWLFRKMNLQESMMQLKSQQIVEHIDLTINSVRKIATELRPEILDNLGLAEALKWQGEQFASRTSIPVKFICSETLPDTSKFGIAFFRIFQESLTNIARHAEASHIVASLVYKRRQLTLKIEDNGKGFDPEMIQHKKTLGLLGMRERIQMLGGNYELHSAQGKGTTLIVSLRC